MAIVPAAAVNRMPVIAAAIRYTAARDHYNGA